MSDIGLFEAIYSTRSMRRLKPDPIPREVMEKIIEAGVHAPSGSNFQNWAFVVVEATDDKRFIRDRYLKYYRELERLGSIPSMDAIPEDRRRMFATATHLAEHMAYRMQHDSLIVKKSRPMRTRTIRVRSLRPYTPRYTPQCKTFCWLRERLASVRH